MIRRVVVCAGLLVMLLVAACADDDADNVQALQPGTVTSFEEIAGTYQMEGPGQFFLHFFADGTLHGSSNRDLVVDRPEVVYQTRFEGTEVFITTTRNCPQPDQGGTYEIDVLETNNLEFVTVDEDTCAGRSALTLFQFAPVP